ncbi:S1/P1 nuclease [Variovorax sp. GT1P44]|uniref:S1/P1 nuclease n=1 Tax=Variovorax sp. GT1P44 TaxID=3443742 RepID=UPI003F44CEEC
MRAATAVLAGMAGLLVTCASSAYGPKGHQMIGAIADTQLSPAAKAAVSKNLGYPLRTAATWADCVKDVEKTAAGKFVYNPDPRFAAACKNFGTTIGKDRMVSYARRNWSTCNDPSATKGCHALYHFTDVAIQHDGYDREFIGTSDHDIVSAMQAAIAKLQGDPVPAPFSIKDKAEAMLMLAHLVGDVHQPLHVGAVYLDANDKPVDPDALGGPHDPKMDTRGGNKLEVGSSNLHADWDGVLTSFDPMNPTPELLAMAKAVPTTTGAPGTWPAVWATESVQTSKAAFTGLAYTHTGAKKADEWVTTFPNRSAYLKEKNAVQKQEMATAGARLAQILNAVWP